MKPATRTSPSRASGAQATSTRLYLGLGLVSAAVLLLELTLTRVFSVSIWYHFAFMVVSIALLGFGASGSFVTVARRRIEADLERVLRASGLLFSATALATLAIAALVPFDPSRLGPEPFPQGLYLFAYYVGLALPFFFAGVVIGSLLACHTERAGQLYGADLLGAGMGCLVFILVLPPLGAQGAIVLSALLAVVATSLFAPSRPGPLRRLISLWAGVLIGLTPTIQTLVDVHIPPSKGLALAAESVPELRRVLTGWNAFSRVDVTEGDSTRFFAGLSPFYQGDLPDQVAIRIDADARTDVTQIGLDPAPLAYLNHLASSLPYQLIEQPGVLVIGSGGGTDVVAALYHGATRVTAVEINPLIVDVVRRQYRSFSGDIYGDPRVSLVVDEGRNFVARSDARYDVLQISLVDTWAAASSGAYSLSENYLYTREAFRTYYRHLSDLGLLTVSRWSREPPVELLRLLATALAALEDEGFAEPARHVAVIKVGDLATTVVRREPFGSQDLERIRGFAGENGFEVVYPAGEGGNPVQEFVEAPDRDRVIAGYPFNIAPTTDDMPFFFQYARWRDLRPGTMIDRLNDHHFAGQVVLLAALAQAILLACLLILAPLAARRRFRAVFMGAPWLPVVAYFSALGLAFMFLEISLIQRLSLFLGHPVYAISVVLCTLLLTGGIGSLLSSRIKRESIRPVLAVVVVGLACVVAAELALLPTLIAARLGDPLDLRILLTVVVIAPLGVLMGMPFPIGLRLTQGTSPALVPWAWGINGCASVVGPVLAVVIAMAGGFPLAAGLAVGVYVVGLLALLTVRPEGSLTRQRSRR